MAETIALNTAANASAFSVLRSKPANAHTPASIIAGVISVSSAGLSPWGLSETVAFATYITKKYFPIHSHLPDPSDTPADL
ncbi:hypothetical protein, partial [Mesorhizobium marinum]|uniref:hypothetical protein n=1 Tax=Mesorhizobium marinum TaxID=3228790 RepID=UPI003465E876